MSLKDKLVRGVGPRALIRAWERQEAMAKAGAGAARLLGRKPVVELYYAFDSPYSAVALFPLLNITEAHGGELRSFVVARHGIEGDPDRGMRRAYEVLDAGRLLKRQGRTLSRTQPVEPGSVEAIALLAEAARRAGRGNAFAAAALDVLWCKEGDGLPELAAYERLYEKIVGRKPATDLGALSAAVRDNETRLNKGHWEVPAAMVGGQWFFAHERLEQIDAWLMELGW